MKRLNFNTSSRITLPNIELGHFCLAAFFVRVALGGLVMLSLSLSALQLAVAKSKLKCDVKISSGIEQIYHVPEYPSQTLDRNISDSL